MTRTLLDLFAKAITQALLDPFGELTFEEEVVAPARRADIVFRPRPERPADWYALAALCATTPGGEAAAIRALRAGAAGAPREAAVVREALESALGEAAAPLIGLLRRDRSEGWRWLAAL